MLFSAFPETGIGIFDLFDKHIKDYSGISSASIDSYYTVTAGTGTHNWNETTQVFSLSTVPNTGSWNKLVVSAKVIGTPNDVNAEIVTNDIYMEQILGDYSMCRAWLRTGINTGTFDLSEDVDSFTVGNTYEATMNFHNDVSEVNAGVVIARVHGTRNNILHEVPLHGGQGNGQSIKIQAKNEGEFYELRLVPVNFHGVKDEIR